MDKPYVITISRGFGSGGKTIGINLSEELGIPCYEDQLLRMASDYSGINEQLFAQVDEKLRGSYIQKMLARQEAQRAARRERNIRFQTAGKKQTSNAQDAYEKMKATQHRLASVRHPKQK